MRALRGRFRPARRFALALAAACLAPAGLTGAALAAPAATGNPPAASGSALDALMADDAQVQTIGWRLASTNAAFCARTTPSIGLLLYDVFSYRNPASVRQSLGIAGDIAVGAVAAGSPAEAAGLRRGEEVIAIAGAPIADEARPAVPSSYRRAERLHARITEALTATGSVTLQVAAGSEPARTVTIAGKPVCSTRFELLTEGNNAGASGDRVRVGRNLLTLAVTDDQAATVIAHELGHNILGHPGLVSGRRTSLATHRIYEREADRLAIWLMINAGYDAKAAHTFMRIWGKRSGGLGVDLFSSHDGWQQRERLMAGELATIDTRRAAQPEGALDWRPAFRPQAADAPPANAPPPRP